MEMLAGIVSVATVEEVGAGEEALVIVDVEEATVVGICNRSMVVTTAMVDQGHHLLKAAVSIHIYLSIYIHCTYKYFAI